MKKKDVILLICIAIVSVAIIALCIVLAFGHRFRSAEVRTPGVINPLYQVHSNQMYFAKEGLRRYDLSSNTFEKLCNDTACNSGCPLENALENFQIYDNLLLFSFSSDTTGFAFYNINTGTTHVIKEYEKSPSDRFFAYNGYIYHEKRESDPEHLTIYCLSIYSGEETEIKLGADEHLAMVADGMIITEKTDFSTDNETEHYSNTFFAYDTKTLKQRILWQNDKNDYFSVSWELQFFDGKLYFILNDGDSCLYGLDVHSGNTMLITDASIDSFCVTEEGICYVTKPKESEYFFGENSKESQPENISTQELWICDLDGRDRKQIDLGANANSIYAFYVRNSIICECAIYSEKANGKLERLNSLMHVNLTTGEIKEIAPPQ